MNINQLLSSRTTGLSTGSRSAQTQATEKLDPVSASINRSKVKLQTQLDTATASLSTLGKFKASISVTQTAAKNLTTLKGASTRDEVKTALTSFITNFNSMVASTKNVAAETSGIESISKGMTRAMTADFSKISELRQMGFTKATDGTLKIDTAKFDAAYKASPSGVQSTLSKLGQLIDKAAIKELASQGRISDSMDSLTSKTSALKLQQSALIKAAQQVSSLSQASISNALSAYRSNL